jgi:hypothetical protein
MSNKIIIKPINGVGDKFINIIGASVYCYYKKYDLKIILNDLILNYHFGSHNHYDLSLFEFNNMSVYNKTTDFCSVEEEKEKGIKQFCNPDTIVSITPYCVYEKLQSEGCDISFEEVSNMFIKIAKDIKPSNLISKYIPNNIENAYGIHLRNTDKIKNNPDIRHEMSYDENNILLEKLMINIEKIIDEEPDPSFFITSENNGFKNEFMNKIQTVATSKNKTVTFLSIDENIERNIKSISNFESILDLFSLSQCKSIIQGVKYSAFSVVAALIGNGNIINLSMYVKSGYLCIIYLWNSVISINNKKNLDKNSYIGLINKYKELRVFYGEFTIL